MFEAEEIGLRCLCVSDFLPSGEGIDITQSSDDGKEADRHWTQIGARSVHGSRESKETRKKTVAMVANARPLFAQMPPWRRAMRSEANQEQSSGECSALA